MGAGPSVENKTFALVANGNQNRRVYTFNFKSFVDDMRDKATEDIPEDILEKARDVGKEDMLKEQWESMTRKAREKIAEWDANPPDAKRLASMYREMFQEQGNRERKAFEKYWEERKNTSKILNMPDPGEIPEHDKSGYPGIFLGLFGDYNLEDLKLVFFGYNPSFIVEKYSRTVFVSPEELARLKALPDAEIPEDCDYGVVLPSNTVVNEQSLSQDGNAYPFEYTQEPTPEGEQDGGQVGGCGNPNCRGCGGGRGGLASLLSRMGGPGGPGGPGVRMMTMGPDGQLREVGGNGGGQDDLIRRMNADMRQSARPEPMDTGDDEEGDASGNGEMSFTLK